MRKLLDGKVALYAGDCLEVLAGLHEASIDSVVCDPPYHLTSIVRRFGAEGAAPARVGATGAYARSSAGFMGKVWDGGDIAFRVETWQQVLRVLKPGGHLIAFSGTRTYHRMACAIEDAGFEIRDQIGWVFGSGFPKSHDVARNIDKAARGVPQGGADPTSPNAGKFKTQKTEGKRSDADAGQHFGAGPGQFMREAGAANTRGTLVPEAEPWRGFGTALKPAWEPICLARKPLAGTVAENVLAHGVGGLNIDGCRVEAQGRPAREVHACRDDVTYGGNALMGRVDGSLQSSRAVGATDLGRWPANIIHDGSEEVLAAFPDSAGQQGDLNETGRDRPTKTCFGDMAPPLPHAARNDSGSAARFFYTAKADAEDRLGSKHPTVKPLDLMQWLVRLVTPKGGTCLDPFAGTGTTGEAAWREGMRAILIEREEEYLADIVRRMELAVMPTKRAAVAKAKGRLEKPEDLPLFAAGADDA